MRRVLRWLVRIVLTLLVIGALALACGWWLLRRSLPALDGSATVPGLTKPVVIERDAAGIPTVRGEDWPDICRAIGFLHGQDRFFQMDVLRRRAAGELSEIFGAGALPLDRAVRLHHFRALARRVLEREPAAGRAAIVAYAEGVNAGLASLGAKPPEYYLVGGTPVPWEPEDTFVAAYAMALELQDSSAEITRTRTALREAVGAVVADFFAPTETPEDAALDGTSAPARAIPAAQIFDARALPAAPKTALVEPEPALLPGSNNFALAGTRTAHGGAIVANDMHLGLSVPNTWYRLSIVLPDRRITGATLPGAPVMIVGSNGRITWGFTNSYIATSSIVPLPADAPLTKYREMIRVKGAEPAELTIETSASGPIVGRDREGHPLALVWSFHSPEATNGRLADMIWANSVGEAIACAHGVGMPPQNFVVGDAAGKIAWTIIGRVPDRKGGFLERTQIPVQRGDQLWTANNRVVGGPALALLGDGGYEAPARARQIRDDLTALPAKARPADVLGVQLDDRALFLERWRTVLLATLTPEACAARPERTELRKFVENWGGRAAIDSVGYRAVRAFRWSVATRVFEPVVRLATQRYEKARLFRLQFEVPLWSLVQAKPLHWLPAKHPSWDALMLEAADEFLDSAVKDAKPLAAMTWGARNTMRIEHPIARFLPPALRGILSMTAEPLPGDGDMPRVQGPTFGASERMVVAPGREEEGIFHMPGGASGHFLSPFFRSGHEDWATGRATPFLPGPAKSKLTLIVK